MEAERASSGRGEGAGGAAGEEEREGFGGRAQHRRRRPVDDGATGKKTELCGPAVGT